MDEKEAKKNVHLKMRNVKRTEERTEERKAEDKTQAKRRTKGKKSSSETEDHEKKRLVTLKRLKRDDENELERKLRRSKKEEKDWRMIQLPNGSGSPWRPMKKEKQDRRNGSYHRVGPGDRGRKKSKKEKEMDFIWL